MKIPFLVYTVVALSASTAVAQFDVEQCGPTGGNQVCKNNKCCSQYGWCGTTNAYCRVGCNPSFGRCTGMTSSVASTLRTSVVSRASTPSASPSPASNRNERCGPNYGRASCLGSIYGSCCSQYGWCGSTTAHCKAGCQSAFGTCSGLTSSVGSSSRESSSASQSTSRVSSSSSTVRSVSSSTQTPSRSSGSTAVSGSSTATPSSTANSRVTSSSSTQSLSSSVPSLLPSSSSLPTFSTSLTGTSSSSSVGSTISSSSSSTSSTTLQDVTPSSSASANIGTTPSSASTLPGSSSAIVSPSSSVGSTSASPVPSSPTASPSASDVPRIWIPARNPNIDRTSTDRLVPAHVLSLYYVEQSPGTAAKLDTVTLVGDSRGILLEDISAVDVVSCSGSSISITFTDATTADIARTWPSGTLLFTSADGCGPADGYERGVYSLADGATRRSLHRRQVVSLVTITRQAASVDLKSSIGSVVSKLLPDANTLPATIPSIPSQNSVAAPVRSSTTSTTITTIIKPTLVTSSVPIAQAPPDTNTGSTITKLLPDKELSALVPTPSQNSMEGAVRSSITSTTSSTMTKPALVTSSVPVAQGPPDTNTGSAISKLPDKELSALVPTPSQNSMEGAVRSSITSTTSSTMTKPALVTSSVPVAQGPLDTNTGSAISKLPDKELSALVPTPSQNTAVGPVRSSTTSTTSSTMTKPTLVTSSVPVAQAPPDTNTGSAISKLPDKELSALVPTPSQNTAVGPVRSSTAISTTTGPTPVTSSVPVAQAPPDTNTGSAISKLPDKELSALVPTPSQNTAVGPVKPSTVISTITGPTPVASSVSDPQSSPITKANLPASLSSAVSAPTSVSPAVSSPAVKSDVKTPFSTSVDVLSTASSITATISSLPVKSTPVVDATSSKPSKDPSSSKEPLSTDVASTSSSSVAVKSTPVIGTTFSTPPKDVATSKEPLSSAPPKDLSTSKEPVSSTVTFTPSSASASTSSLAVKPTPVIETPSSIPVKDVDSSKAPLSTPSSTLSSTSSPAPSLKSTPVVVSSAPVKSPDQVLPSSVSKSDMDSKSLWATPSSSSSVDIGVSAGDATPTPSTPSTSTASDSQSSTNLSTSPTSTSADPTKAAPSTPANPTKPSFSTADKVSSSATPAPSSDGTPSALLQSPGSTASAQPESSSSSATPVPSSIESDVSPSSLSSSSTPTPSPVIVYPNFCLRVLNDRNKDFVVKQSDPATGNGGFFLESAKSGTSLFISRFSIDDQGVLYVNTPGTTGTVITRYSNGSGARFLWQTQSATLSFNTCTVRTDVDGYRGVRVLRCSGGNSTRYKYTAFTPVVQTSGPDRLYGAVETSVDGSITPADPSTLIELGMFTGEYCPSVT